MSKILMINGPNLNLLGTREPEKYGSETLADVESKSNHEGAIVDRIHQAKKDDTLAVVINAGAYTHTSVAIRDALAGVAIPFIEVHITNVHARESFRHHSYLSDQAVGVIVGLGTAGYTAAISFCAHKYLQ